MTIRTPLMEHQKTIVNFAKNKSYIGIFADYGTGKTLAILAYLNLVGFRKILVVSTKTAIQSTWPTEIRIHTNFQYVILVGSKKHKLDQLYFGLKKSQVYSSNHHGNRATTTLFMVNFDGVKNIFSELVLSNFDMIIIDESTKIKNNEALRTKVLWALGKEIKHRCIMTGFPVTENLAELYSQIKFLDNGETFGNSWYAFMNRYFTRIGYMYVPRKAGVLDILRKIKQFCIRIEGTVLKLPPKIYKTLDVQITSQQQKLLDSLNNYFAVEFGKVKIDTEYIFTLISKSLQICDGFIKDDKGNIEIVPTNKDEMLFDLLEEIDPRKNKVVIWCNFKFSVNKIIRLIKKVGWNYTVLTGDTENANSVVHKFQHSKDCNILVATLKKASESITLTNCNYAIYYSNIWSYDYRYNSEARIYRKGSEKHKHVVYTDLVTKGSIEEKVILCLKNKKKLIDVLKQQFLEVREHGKG